MRFVTLIKRITTALVLGASLAASALAQTPRGPTTPDEATRIARLAVAADKDPVGAMGSPEGRWFQKWVEEAPDYQLGPDKGVYWAATSGAATGDLKRVLRFQHTVSTAAYQIEHRILDPFGNEAQMEARTLAGIEGLLRAYESLVAQRAENRSPQLDEALALRQSGRLPAFVKALPAMPSR